jgi:hypothetical protein
MRVFKDEGRGVRDFGHWRRPMLRLAVSRF